ncbi:MAG: esterase [Spirochaetota bacterium]
MNCKIREGGKGSLTIVLLHGYGANYEDLVPLSQYIPAPPNTTWIFPDAIHSLDMVPGGRAWFPLSLNATVDTSDPEVMALAKPPGMEEVRKELDLFFEALARPEMSIVLGGFSQGAMVSLDYVLHSNLSPKFLFLLSSTLVKKAEYTDLAAKKKIPFYQSHGLYDQVLFYQVSLVLHEVLKNAGWEGDFREFPDGHTIPPQVMDDMGKILTTLL